MPWTKIREYSVILWPLRAILSKTINVIVYAVNFKCDGNCFLLLLISVKNIFRMHFIIQLKWLITFFKIFFQMITWSTLTAPKGTSGRHSAVKWERSLIISWAAVKSKYIQQQTTITPFIILLHNIKNCHLKLIYIRQDVNCAKHKPYVYLLTTTRRPNRQIQQPSLVAKSRPSTAKNSTRRTGQWLWLMQWFNINYVLCLTFE